MELIKLFSSNKDLKKQITLKLSIFLVISSILSMYNASGEIENIAIAAVFVPMSIIVTLIQPIFQMKIGTSGIVGKVADREEISYSRAIYYCVMQFVNVMLVALLYLSISMACIMLFFFNNFVVLLAIILLLIFTFIFVIIASLVDVAIIDHMINDKKGMVGTYFHNIKAYLNQFKMAVISVIILVLFVVFINSKVIILIGTKTLIASLCVFVFSLISNIIMLWIMLSYYELIATKLVKNNSKEVELKVSDDIDEEIEAALDFHQN